MAHEDNRSAAPRLAAVDLLRGIVMVVMALDHVRDFISSARFDPSDLARTWPSLFATRWITHFCAPTFVFLAGTGAFLQQKNGKSAGALARFLVTRGAWLVLLELTVVRLGWELNFDYDSAFVQVIWAIGASMVLLAPLVFLPARVVGALGVALIVLHDLADGVKAHGDGVWADLWRIIHTPGPVALPGGHTVFIAYPLVPWVGVMAAGYAFGLLLDGAADVRRRRLSTLGGSMVVAFVVLRAAGVYGDPRPWHAEDTFARSVISFLACEKYPPSLCYLLMTLGPGILALPLLERVTSKLARPFVVFGRVPLFYYVLHLFLAHAVAIALSVARYGAPLSALWHAPFGVKFPDGYGYSLPIVYVVWLLVVIALYPACAWFAGVKRRRRDLTWLSYL
jgi:uncharacterized membrane protein